MRIRIQLFTSMRIRIPLHFNADPDLTLRFNADPDPTLHFNADPDPAPHPSDANLRPHVYRASNTIVRIHGPPRLHIEPLNSLMNFDINANPAFHSNAEPDPASQNNADQDAQPNPAVDKALRICIRPP
jgi:hypothetical protein